MFNTYSKFVAFLLLISLFAHPIYDVMRDFSSARYTRMQSINYEFSRYLRSRNVI